MTANVTKEQAGFDEFKASDTYAMLAEYMGQEPGILPWTIENRIWTAYRAGWLTAQRQVDASACASERHWLDAIFSEGADDPNRCSADCVLLRGHPGPCLRFEVFESGAREHPPRQVSGSRSLETPDAAPDRHGCVVCESPEHTCLVHSSPVSEKQ